MDPPDGRIPVLAALPPERQKVRASRAEAPARFAAGLPHDYTDMSWRVRCVVRTDVPPYLPTIFNNNFQIFQSPGYVTIAPEMIHSARIIPVDGRPHLNKGLRQWLGDTRGRWEGATLAVETTNFKAEEGVLFQGQPRDLHDHRPLTRGPGRDLRRPDTGPRGGRQPDVGYLPVENRLLAARDVA